MDQCKRIIAGTDFRIGTGRSNSHPPAPGRKETRRIVGGKSDRGHDMRVSMTPANPDTRTMAPIIAATIPTFFRTKLSSVTVPTRSWMVRETHTHIPPYQTLRPIARSGAVPDRLLSVADNLSPAYCAMARPHLLFRVGRGPIDGPWSWQLLEKNRGVDRHSSTVALR